MLKNRLFITVFMAVLVMLAGLAFGADFTSSGVAACAAMCLGETGDLAGVLAAIENSNKAFEEFKKTNDAQLELIKKGAHVPDDIKAKLEATATAMAEQKAVIEKLEAKLNRPLLGADGKPLDQAAEEHKKAFGGFMRKGVEYDRAIEEKSLGVSAGTDGGFAVPKVIDSMIDATLVNVSPIRGIAKVQQISTQDFHKLVNTHGTSSGWVGESEARTSTNTPQLKDMAPPMGELYANPQATQQMLDDVFFNAEQWLADEVALEFARAEGAAFVTGTGVKQPKGFASYNTAATADATRTWGSLEHVATGAAGAFKTLTSTVNPADDLFTLVSKMKKGYRNGAQWVLNKNTLFQIMSFKDYQGRYVFNPTTAPGVEDTILGYPVTEAEDMPDYTTSGGLGVAFGNFNLGYLIVDRIGTRVLRDPFSNKPYIGFYTTKRLGGGVVNFEAIKFLKFS